jgi:hypothetical protein
MIIITKLDTSDRPSLTLKCAEKKWENIAMQCMASHEACLGKLVGQSTSLLTENAMQGNWTTLINLS